MKGDWDKLAKKYKNSNVMIVDVDCTAAGKGTCGKHGVKGYPTIKYFKAGKKSGSAYQGGRDFASLDRQAKTLDVPACDPVTLKGCLPIEKKFIEAQKGKTKSELSAILTEKKDGFKETETTFKAAKKEFRATEKSFKKDQKKFKLAETILKKLIKTAPESKDEL